MPTISNLSDAALNEIIDSIARTPASALSGRVPPDLLAVAAAALAAAAEDAESAAAADDGAASAAGDGAMAVDEAVGRHFVAGAIKRSRSVFSKSPAALQAQGRCSARTRRSAIRGARRARGHGGLPGCAGAADRPADGAGLVGGRCWRIRRVPQAQLRHARAPLEAPALRWRRGCRAGSAEGATLPIECQSG